MSWFSKSAKRAERAISQTIPRTQISKSEKIIERAISRAIPHTHSAERRAELEALNMQMDLYKTQKDLLTQERDRIAAERNIEEGRLAEKQIRAMRGKMRPTGFMGVEPGELSERLG